MSIPKRVFILPLALAFPVILGTILSVCHEAPSSDVKHRGSNVRYRPAGTELDFFEAECVFLTDMYFELLEFKDTREFRDHGFDEGGPFFSWKSDLDRWMEGDITPSALVLAEEIAALGTQYLRTYGIDNMDTASRREFIETQLDCGEPQ